MKTLICLFLSTACFATNLDLPGSIEATYDQRLTDKVEGADNSTGRQQIHIEQGFTDSRIKKDFLAYVGYNLYAPNEVPVDNHLLFGVKNQSLLPPFTLKLEYQTPIHQAVDTSNTFVFSITYDRNWNLIKSKQDKDE